MQCTIARALPLPCSSRQSEGEFVQRRRDNFFERGRSGRQRGRANKEPAPNDAFLDIKNGCRSIVIFIRVLIIYNAYNILHNTYDSILL